MTHNKSDAEFSDDFEDDYYDNYDPVAEAAKEQEEMLGFILPIDATPDALPVSTPSLQQPLISELSSTSPSLFTSNRKFKHCKRHADYFHVTHHLTMLTKFTGKNTVFRKGRSSFFLLDFPIKHKRPQHRIVTNNTKLQEFIFNSDRRNASTYYTVKQFISGIFRFLAFHKRFDVQTRQRYFDCVWRHMKEQYIAVRTRLHKNTKNCTNDNQTRTYFQFSVGKSNYYFGFHVSCASSNCNNPCTFVTRHGSHCWAHWKQLRQRLTPPPLHHQHVMTKAVKKCISNRLGVSYTKEISFSRRNDKFYVVYKNFETVSSNPQQVLRRNRLTRSSTSNTSYKLISASRSSVAFPCHHQPLHLGR